jgi:hypothetical protein
MVTVIYPDVNEAQSARQDKVGTLQLMQRNDFEIYLEPLTARDIANNNTGAILTWNSHLSQ